MTTLGISRRAALLAAFAAPLGGAVLLLGSTYRAELCFRGRSGGGCFHSEETFFSMLSESFPRALWPQLFGPVVLVLVLGAIAAAALLASSRGNSQLQALLAGLFGFVALGSTVYVGPHFLPAYVLLLVASLGPDRPLRETGRDLGLVGLAAAVALAGSELFRQVLGRTMGFGGGIEYALDLYVAFAVALAAGLALLARALGQDRAVARGIGVAFAGLGLGGALAFVLGIPSFYPEGRYVNLGMAGIWSGVGLLLLANAAVGPFALRIGMRAPWRVALPATLFAGLLLIVTLISSLAPMNIQASPIERPGLPNTSTR